jgi:superfamily II DNA or RNA helicase
VPANSPTCRQGDVVRIRGERWRIVRQLSSGNSTILETIGCETANRATQAHFILPFETLQRVPAPGSPRLARLRGWRRVARQAVAEANPSWNSLQAATRANLTLIPFQLEPTLALVRGSACRFLIADAVGLGKTVQAGLMIAETILRRPDATALVVSPAGLRGQWLDELHGRFHLHADVLDAAGVARISAQLPAGVNPWAICPLVITSIDYVKRPEVMRSLESIIWDVVVLDEAHNLSGRSDRSLAAAALGSRARVLVLLTATPHSGDERAYSRLCSLGDLTGAEPLLIFRRTRVDAGVEHARRTTLLRVRPTAPEAAMHAALMAYARLVWRQSEGADRTARLAVSVLARRACSSAASLVRSVDRRIVLLADAAPAPRQTDLPFVDEAGEDDEEPYAALDWPGLRDRSDELARLQRLLGLARLAAAAESKLGALQRLLTKSREPAIVFTEYRDTLRTVGAQLNGIDTVQLHGGMTPRERNDALRCFADGGARVLLATDAASEGLNLHHRCRLVINLELPWTPVRLEQRAGRVDRIGQARRVHAVHLVAGGTCEESTLARLARRIDRMQASVGVTNPIQDMRSISESVLENRSIREVECEPRASCGVVTIDLGAEAREETNRIGWARDLLGPNGRSSSDGRPVIALCRRRVGRPECFWMFRLCVVNAARRMICELPLCLAGGLERIPVTAEGSRQLARHLLNPAQRSLAMAIERARADIPTELNRLLHDFIVRSTRRERDLMSGLRNHHARLSAGLLQRALFDHRTDRMAAAQRVLLDAALSRSEHRLSDLSDCAHLQIDAYELMFAVAFK